MQIEIWLRISNGSTGFACKLMEVVSGKAHFPKFEFFYLCFLCGVSENVVDKFR